MGARFRFLLVFCALSAFFAVPAVYAQQEVKAPKLALTVSLQNDKLRYNHPVIATILVANESAIPVTAAELFITVPDFIGVHPGDCDQPEAGGPITLGAMAAYSALASPQTVCLILKARDADLGKFNLLAGVNYSFEGGSGVVSTEKAIEVDLIGSTAVLGVPIAFAGFVLPGLMFLVTLKWFGLPWAKGLGTEDRLIYAVFISLILLGPLTVLAQRMPIPEWLQFLNLQQAVSIERLAVYILTGLVLGVIGGVWYQIRERRKKAAEKAAADARAALQISQGEAISALIYKGLQLNSDYRAKKLYFQKNDGSERVTGYHYARSGDKLYVFSSFTLVISRLDSSKQASIKAAAGALDTFHSDAKRIGSLAAALDKVSDAAFIISYSAAHVKTGDGNSPVISAPYVTIDPSEYSDVSYEAEGGFLLELSENEPY